MKCRRAFLVVVLVLFGFPLKSFSQPGLLPVNYFHYRTYLALNDYFRQHNALAILHPLDEKSGDVYRLPGLEISNRRKKCFPGYKGGPHYLQHSEGVKKTFKAFLAGDLSATISKAVKGEIEGKVVLDVFSVVKFEKLTKESPGTGKLQNEWEKKSCPFLEGYFYKKKSDGKNLLIGAILRGNGVASFKYTLAVKGSVSVEVAKILAKIFGDVGAKIAGGADQTFEKFYKYKENIPVAFVPLYISKQDLEVHDAYIRKGIDKYLEKIKFDERRHRGFFGDFRDLRQDPQDIIMSMASGPLLPFDEKNSSHSRYLRFKADLMYVNFVRVNKFPLLR